MGVTIWNIGKGGHYASNGQTKKYFAQNLVDHGSTNMAILPSFRRGNHQNTEFWSYHGPPNFRQIILCVWPLEA